MKAIAFQLEGLMSNQLVLKARASLRGCTIKNLSKWFVLSAGAILLFWGIEQIIQSLDQNHAYDLQDPIFGIRFRWVELLLGIVEVCLATLCLFTNKTNVSLWLVAWLIGEIGVYRGGLWEMGWYHPYPLVSPFTQTFLVPARTADFLMAFLAVYLFIGSIGCLVNLWKRTQRTNFLKMSCHSCGGHIRFATRNLGQATACPHCKTTVTLRQPEESLKTFCYFCKGHIAFPAHALGQKIACPHCKMDITLKCHASESNAPLSH